MQCPWDRKQTLDSLKRYLIEESYEVLDSMSDVSEHREELGDLFFKFFFSVIENKKVSSILAMCLIASPINYRRHPHVFGDLKVEDASEVKDIWQAIKAQERKAKKQGKQKSPKVFGGIP